MIECEAADSGGGDCGGASGGAREMVPVLARAGVPVLEAMQSGTPVITSSRSSMQEVGGDAALYASPQHFEEIAEQMLLIYKDEALRSRLVEKGLERATSFSWDSTAEKLWAALEKLSA